MAVKCDQCLQEFSVNDCIAKCVSCTKSFHPACTRLKSAQNFTKAKLKLWKCDSCREDSASTTSARSDDDGTDTKSILEAIAAMKVEINSNTDKKVGEVAESLNSLRRDLKHLNEKCAELEKKHSEMGERCTKLEQENWKLRDKLTSMEVDSIDKDQRARSANIEIQGLPVSNGEDIYYCLEKIAGVLKLPHKRDDISIAHRLKLFSNRHAHPPIVVQFVSRSKREEWLIAARRKKDFNATEIVGTFTSSSIRINEHLTPHNKALLGRARRLKREGKLFFVGFFGGRVLVKPVEGSESVRVVHMEDLDRFEGK